MNPKVEYRAHPFGRVFVAHGDSLIALTIDEAESLRRDLGVELREANAEAEFTEHLAATGS